MNRRKRRKENRGRESKRGGEHFILKLMKCRGEIEPICHDLNPAGVPCGCFAKCGSETVFTSVLPRVSSRVSYRNFPSGSLGSAQYSTSFETLKILRKHCSTFILRCAVWMEMGEDNYPKAGTLERSTRAECPRHRDIVPLRRCSKLVEFSDLYAQEPSSTRKI